MPIINWISVLEEEKGKDEEDLKKLAMERMNEAANLRLSINEKPVPLDLSILGFNLLYLIQCCRMTIFLTWNQVQPLLLPMVSGSFFNHW